MAGKVDAIWVASEAKGHLHELLEASLEAGRGLVGDRYYLGRGTFSEKLKGKPDVEVTLIESEEVAQFNAAGRSAWRANAFRRNIVTSGVRLTDLVGRSFGVGAARLEGVRLCEPCAHLATFVGADVMERMAHRAGLRARIVSGAVIRKGDVVG